MVETAGISGFTRSKTERSTALSPAAPAMPPGGLLVRLRRTAKPLREKRAAHVYAQSDCFPTESGVLFSWNAEGVVMKFRRKALMPVLGILIFVVPVIVVICRSADPDPVAPAGSSRRPEPRRDPTMVIRTDVMDAAARADGQALLDRMRSHWRSLYEFSLKHPGCGFVPPGRFIGEWHGYFTEVRLFSLGYPHLAEEWATAIVERAETPAWERYQALTCLGVLWNAGWSSAGPTLVNIHRHSPPGHYDPSVSLLSDGDREGRYRSLYRELARKGDYYGLHAISHWNEAQWPAILEEAREQLRLRPQENFILKIVDQQIQPRMAALASGEWQALVRKTLQRESEGSSTEHFRWALRIAFDRQPAWLEGVLRERIAQAYKSGAVLFDKGDRPISRGTVYDDMLVLLARIGGTLTAQERSYLEFYGYGCEPRARLRGVLQAKGYAS